MSDAELARRRPELAGLEREVARWEAVLAGPVNPVTRPQIEERVRRLRAALATYRLKARRELAQADIEEELAALGEETPAERLRRLRAENPFSWHHQAEFVCDEELQKLVARERRNGG